MHPCFSRPRIFACIAAMGLCGAASHASAAVLAAIPDAVDAPQGDYDALPEAPAECSALRDQIEALDEVIAQHPDVRAARDAYDASELGRRERVAMQALSAEHCFADAEGTISETCAALMLEIDTCATAFENSADFQHIQALPEVVEFDRLSQRFADLCAARMPALEDDCDGFYDDESEDDFSCDPEDDICDGPEEVALPGTV